jgi:hypothetical protein
VLQFRLVQCFVRAAVLFAIRRTHHEPSGAFGRAYQTHSVLRSIWPTGAKPLTPEQGQDFQHHARCLREGVDSGLPENGIWKCRQKQPRKPMLLLRLPGSFLLRLAERQFSGLLIQEPPRSLTLSLTQPIRLFLVGHDTKKTNIFFFSLRSEERRKKKRAKGKRTKDKV